MPFTKHLPKKQHIISKTPLIKGSFFYEEVEKGLYLIHSHLNYHANINYIKTGDGKESENWCLLNLTVFGVKQKLALLNGVPHTNCAWILYKPNTWGTNCHFKGAEEIAFTFYFSKDWLAKKFKSNPDLMNSPIRRFFDSKAGYDIVNDDVHLCKPLYEKIISNFNEVENRSPENSLTLKEASNKLINYFLAMYSVNNIAFDHFKVPDKTRIIIYKVEKILLENLTSAFPGLDFLTKEGGVSETTLKVNFKLIFGTSPGQYFQQKQMFLAREVLLSENIMIKDLAIKMGYTNASKFTTAFKKHNGILPSELP